MTRERAEARYAFTVRRSQIWNSILIPKYYDPAVDMALGDVDLSNEELELARALITDSRKDLEQTQAAAHEALHLQEDQMHLRLTKLTDLLIDGTIDKAAFGERRDALVLEQARIKERLAEIERNPASVIAALEKTVELAKSPSVLYKAASPEKKRELLKTLLSNLAVSGKNVDVTMALSFRLIAEREKMSASRPHRATCRTWEEILKNLIQQFKSEVVAPA